MRAIIDRFEGEYAVVEIEGEFKHIERRKLPAEAREGDVLAFHDRKWVIQKRITSDLKKEIDKLADELWED